MARVVRDFTVLPVLSRVADVADCPLQRLSAIVIKNIIIIINNIIIIIIRHLSASGRNHAFAFSAEAGPHLPTPEG